MITNNNIVSISQMRKETDAVMRKIDSSDQPVYLFSRSKIKAVMINPDKFAEMQEIIEDYEDQKALMSIGKKELELAEDWEKIKTKLKNS
jgi:PHD/YefM family antitoxin component YafN of YafNO toxin-antitoxin module